MDSRTSMLPSLQHLRNKHHKLARQHTHHNPRPNTNLHNKNLNNNTPTNLPKRNNSPRNKMLKPNKPRHRNKRPLSLHPPPSIHLQKPIMVDNPNPILLNKSRPKHVHLVPNLPPSNHHRRTPPVPRLRLHKIPPKSKIQIHPLHLLIPNLSLNNLHISLPKRRQLRPIINNSSRMKQRNQSNFQPLHRYFPNLPMNLRNPRLPLH